MKASSKKSVRTVLLTTSLLVVLVASIAYFMFRLQGSKERIVTNKETKSAQPKREEFSKEKRVASSSGTVIKTGNSQFGPMLFDSRGQAIYIWEVEKSSTAECYSSCAVAWPPVLTSDSPVASGDVNEKMLGTTKRADGTTQVTYNGHPLYFYANEKPGEVECHNIRTHGGLWWVIQPSGIRAK